MQNRLGGPEGAGQRGPTLGHHVPRARVVLAFRLVLTSLAYSSSTVATWALCSSSGHSVAPRIDSAIIHRAGRRSLTAARVARAPGWIMHSHARTARMADMVPSERYCTCTAGTGERRNAYAGRVVVLRIIRL